MDRQAQRFHVELEENAGGTAIMLKHARVVRNTVLVCAERRGARRNVSRRDDMEEVLVGDKSCRSEGQL